MSYIPPTPRAPFPPRPSATGSGGDGAAVRIAAGGCEWCGANIKHRGGTSCCRCGAREEGHRRRMNALAEREAELRIKVLEQQLGEHTDDTEGTT